MAVTSHKGRATPKKKPGRKMKVKKAVKRRSAAAAALATPAIPQARGQERQGL